MHTLAILCCISYSLYASTHYDEVLDAMQKGDISALSSIINNPLGQTFTKKELTQLLIQAQKNQTSAQKELKEHYKKPSILPFIGISALVGTAYTIKLFKPSRLSPYNLDIPRVISLQRPVELFKYFNNKGYEKLYNDEDFLMMKTRAQQSIGLLTASAIIWKLYDLYLQKKNKLFFAKVQSAEEAVHIIKEKISTALQDKK